MYELHYQSVASEYGQDDGQYDPALYEAPYNQGSDYDPVEQYAGRYSDAAYQTPY